MECLVEWAAWVAWAEWACNTIPVQNTLRTRVKQIRNPQKEISGGFFYLIFCELYMKILNTTYECTKFYFTNYILYAMFKHE